MRIKTTNTITNAGTPNLVKGFIFGEGDAGCFEDCFEGLLLFGEGDAGCFEGLLFGEKATRAGCFEDCFEGLLLFGEGDAGYFEGLLFSEGDAGNFERLLLLGGGGLDDGRRTGRQRGLRERFSWVLGSWAPFAHLLELLCVLQQKTCDLQCRRSSRST